MDSKGIFGKSLHFRCEMKKGVNWCVCAKYLITVIVFHCVRFLSCLAYFPLCCCLWTDWIIPAVHSKLQCIDSLRIPFSHTTIVIVIFFQLFLLFFRIFSFFGMDCLCNYFYLNPKLLRLVIDANNDIQIVGVSGKGLTQCHTANAGFCGINGRKSPLQK